MPKTLIKFLENLANSQSACDTLRENFQPIEGCYNKTDNYRPYYRYA